MLNQLLLVIVFVTILTSCYKETYKQDRNNKLSGKAERANDFHAKQAQKITRENLEDREKEMDKAHKKREQDQRKMLSQKGKSSKSRVKHEGKFAFY